MARSRKPRKAAPKLARDKSGRWRYGGKFVSEKRAKDIGRKRKQRVKQSKRPASVVFRRDRGPAPSEFGWTIYDRTKLPGASKMAERWARDLEPLNGWRVRVTVVFHVQFPDTSGRDVFVYSRSAEFTDFSYFDVFGHGAFLYVATKEVQAEVRSEMPDKGSKDYQKYVVNVRSIHVEPLRKR